MCIYKILHYMQKERFCWSIKNFSQIQIGKYFLLNHQNNYLEFSSMLNNPKDFDIPAVWMSYIVILMIQQN